MWRRSHRSDQGFASKIALQTPELFGRDHDDFIASVNGNMLRPLTTDTSHQFTKACLGVLQQPLASFQTTPTSRFFCRYFLNSGHTD
jgi:hypothetical protein